MPVSVKFCGLTSPGDARAAVECGASYVGAVFAGGPRVVTPQRAREVFGGSGTRAARVGVFGADPPDRIGEAARQSGLDVIQLHGDPRAADVHAVRSRFGGRVWAAARGSGAQLPEWAAELFREADAVLLDARVPGALGGTGVALDWGAIARALDAVRGSTPVVLAGGLTPSNVAEAIRTDRKSVV